MSNTQKICLVNPTNIQRDWGHSFPPLGLAALAAQAKALGLPVMIFDRDLLFEQSGCNMKAVDLLTEKMLAEEQPEILGITATTPLIVDAYKVARLAKRILPSIKVVIGGVHATVLPQRTMAECAELDYLVVGEGEKTFSEILLKKKPSEIFGCYYREGETIVANPPREPIKELDVLPLPARELLNMATYTRRSKQLIRGVSLRGTSVFTSRGCPYRCSFCCGPLVFGRSLRFHSVNYVLREIEHLLEQYNIEGVYFADDMFASNRQRAFEICDELIRRGLNKKLVFAVQLKVTAVDMEFLSRLKQAGCIQVEFGFESGSQRMLALINKGVKVADNFRAANLARQAGLRFLANLMTGFPGENKEDLDQTINFLKEIKPDVAGFYKLILLPGSKFYNDYAHCFVGMDNWEHCLVDDLTTNFTSMPTKDFISDFKDVTRRIAISNARHYISYHLQKDFVRTICDVFFLAMRKLQRYFLRERRQKG